MDILNKVLKWIFSCNVITVVVCIVIVNVFIYSLSIEEYLKQILYDLQFICSNSLEPKVQVTCDRMVITFETVKLTLAGRLRVINLSLLSVIFFGMILRQLLILKSKGLDTIE